MLGPIQLTWPNIPEEHNLLLHCCKNLITCRCSLIILSSLRWMPG